MTIFPRITFGMIVLNGEPFIRYNLRALYPFAHQIIVVEGAAPGAVNIASLTGHSRDRTLKVLRAFTENEDPENKIIIVTAEDDGHPDGFWPGEKDQQSQAYARRATGDYLWQVDVDEFYKLGDMHKVIGLLRDYPETTAVSFKMRTFWGGFDYLTDGWYLRRGADQYHRLFRWDQDFRYITHRPPTVVDEEGRDLRNLSWIPAKETAKKGIFLYHYSLVFPKQVADKADYYGNAEWAKRDRSQQWARDAFKSLQRPFRVHNVYLYPSWLERFLGSHPQQILKMREDITAGRLEVDLRSTSDIELILGSKWYRLGRAVLQLLTPLHVLWHRLRRFLSTLKIYLGLS